ncbi:MAG TPA: substrate-binding domain-containing protein [Aggregatilineales bacterium]|nr:substrate-binding domain-containing protein [Anaerolineales bacterium]HRE46878.1 substrate-binding domain-containing protein [Aggregatilineales bacterium]
MSSLRRIVALALVFTVVATTAPVYAQPTPPTPVTLDGSALVAKALESIKTAYLTTTPDAQIEIGVSGTAGGFEKFCAGELDIAMAYGAITDAQAAICQTKGVAFTEVLLGYDAAVVVVNTTSPATCLSLEQLNALLSPSAANGANWNVIDPALGDVAISAVYAPPTDAQSRFLFDRLITGEGLRSDLTIADTAAAMIEKIGAEPNAVGIMTLADFAKGSSGKNVRPLQVRVGTTCLEPTAINLDEARYPALEALYLYVNVARLERPEVSQFALYALSASGQTKIQDATYTTAGSLLYERGRKNLETKTAGRTYSRIQRLNIAADTVGTVNIGGSAAIFTLMKTVNNTFTPRFTGVVLNYKTLGNDRAYSDLCASAVDVAAVTRTPGETETNACQTAGVQTLQLKVGYEGIVVLVNGENTFATCLTLEEVGKLFGAKTAPKQWSEVRAAFPTSTILPILPKLDAPEGDLLMTRAVKDQVAPAIRQDGVTNADPLYRATGTQNAEGGVTFMRYSDYTKTANKVNLVQIDGGNGCVTPEVATLGDGSYPLTFTYYLAVNTKAFSRPEVRAFTWYLLSDDALTVIGNSGVLGTDTAAFAGSRESVLALFEAAEKAAIPPAPTAEATAAATVEVVAPPTPEPTAEATAEPTTEAVTPTAAATTEPTPEPTAAPTATPGQ